MKPFFLCTLFPLDFYVYIFLLLLFWGGGAPLPSTEYTNRISVISILTSAPLFVPTSLTPAYCPRLGAEPKPTAPEIVRSRSRLPAKWRRAGADCPRNGAEPEPTAQEMVQSQGRLPPKWCRAGADCLQSGAEPEPTAQ